MRNVDRLSRVFFRGGLLLTVLYTFAPSCVYAAQAGAVEPVTERRVAVVAHVEVPAHELTLAQVRNIFLAERQFWAPRLRIRLVVPEPGAWEHEVLLKSVYLMSEAQFRRFWIRKVFAAEVTREPAVGRSNGARRASPCSPWVIGTVRT